MLALALACGAERPRPRDVLLISLDTVRADRIGAYGREDAGTPTIDAIAALGARFAEAQAPSPLTLPSHASLLTGQDPLRHGVRHNGLFALSSEFDTLAERLSEAGFATGAFVASIVLAERHGLPQGFDRYSAPGLGRAPGLFFLGERPASEVNRDALEWLDTIGERPFFLFVHYMEPHAPFDPPEPERTRFAADPYQGEIAAADRALRELLRGLEARDRLARTLIVLVADHGESLGDHAELSHGMFLYQSTLHVPMLIAGPGVGQGRVFEDPVGIVDVAPTVLEAFGLAPSAPADGRSQWPALTRGAPSAPRSLYAETFLPRYDYGWSELRSLRRGSDKFILAPRPELYSLADDPTESTNRIARAPALASLLARELVQRVARDEAVAAAADARVGLDPDEREALAQLGYLIGSHEGEGESPVDPKDRVGDAVAMERVGRLLREEKYRPAERILRELLERNPRLFEARVRLLLTLILSGQRDAAVAEGAALAEAARDLPAGARAAARGHLLLGGMHRREGEFALAAQHFERALAAPQPPRVRIELAAIYRADGRPEEAIRVLRALAADAAATPRAREMLRELEAESATP